MQEDAEMQTDAEMPNDSMEETLDNSASESDAQHDAAGMTDSSENEMSASDVEDTAPSKKSKKSAGKKASGDKAGKRGGKSGGKSSKKSVAAVLNASDEELPADLATDGESADSATGLATDAEITEAIESVSNATQVAWEAAHLAFEEDETSMPETDPEAETEDGAMAADSDSSENEDEIEETEVDVDAAITASIEQMGFAALENSEKENEATESDDSEVNFMSGESLDDETSEDDGLEAASNDGETSTDENGMEFNADGDSDSEVGEIEDPADNDADTQPTEFIEADHLVSIVESMLFSTDKPVSIATIKQMFKGSNVRTKDITRALDILASDYASATRGVTLEEINGGFQLRSKVDNAEYLRRLQKSRPFRLSGPALEVMSIVAYKQPVTKHEIDEIRGVESGHLLRALMERGMVNFAGKSDLPGKPMAYGTTRKFLEIFGLRNLKELPTLSEIDEILPQGIGETEEKEKLSDLTGQLSTEVTAASYSEGEDELDEILTDLSAIDTTSAFFEQEKQRERDRRDRDKAQDIREKIVMGDDVEEKDRRWLDRYEAKLLAMEQAAASGTLISIPNEEGDAAPEIGAALESLSADEISADGISADGISADGMSEDREMTLAEMNAMSDEDEEGDESDLSSEDENTEAQGDESSMSADLQASEVSMEGASLDDMPKFEAAGDDVESSDEESSDDSTSSDDGHDDLITPESMDASAAIVNEIGDEESDMLDDLEAVLDWDEDAEALNDENAMNASASPETSHEASDDEIEDSEDAMTEELSEEDELALSDETPDSDPEAHI